MAKQCENYGRRVQNSVFECILDQAQSVVLKQSLIDIIDENVDSLRFYYLTVISKQFLDLTLCNSANGGKACIYGLFRHLLYGRTIRI